jgi:aspartate/tyrosine/aromatic aminotransferase
LGRQVLESLRDKASVVLPAPDWHVHYALFSRSGFTRGLTDEAEDKGVWLVELTAIVQDE